VKFQVARALFKIGTDADDYAVRQEIKNILLAEFEREARANGNDTAANALMELGSDAVGLLIKTLKSDSASTRAYAARFLGEIRMDARDAVPALHEALRDPDENVRRWAAKSLGKYAGEAKEAVPSLAKILDGPDSYFDLGLAVAEALGEIGPQAEAAIPSLVQELDHPNLRVRISCTNALREIGPAASNQLTEAGVPALISALESHDPTVRRNAAICLGTMGPQAEAAIPALIDALGKGSACESAWALGEIGPTGKTAVRALTKSLESDDLGLPKHAYQALAKITGRAS
jgi:HEAT repeat protein